MRFAALAVLAALALPAHAQQRLAVVELSTPPTMIGLGSQVTQKVLEEAARQGYQVIEPDALRVALGEHAYDELTHCEGSPACIAAHLAPIGAQRAIAGSLNRDEKSYLLKLSLVDLSTGALLTRVDRPILIAARRFLLDATSPIAALLRGEREATGTLKLTGRVPHAEASVDGAAVGQLPVTLELKPGKHEVQVTKPNYFPEQKLVTIEAGTVTEEEVRILLEPGKTDPDEEQARERAEAAEDARKLAAAPRQPEVGSSATGFTAPPLRTTSFHLSPVGWTALGVGAAAVGTGVYLGSSARAIEERLQFGYDLVHDTYRGTRAEALLGRSQAFWANIALGLGGAVLVGGLIFTAIDNRPVQVRVSAAVAPGGGALCLTGSFQ